MQLGAYALAKNIGADFLLTPMANIGHSQKFSYTQDEWDDHFFSFTRDFLLPGSIIAMPENQSEIKMSVNSLLKILEESPDILQEKTISLDWREMKSLTDSRIYLLDNLTDYLIDHYKSKSSESNTAFTVSMHVRRYTEEDTDPSQWRDYYVPNVPNGLVEVGRKLMGSRNGEFHIYSQGELSQFKYFEQLSDTGKVVFHLDEDPVSTLDGMIRSDEFVMAKSSFSYIASIYRNRSYYRGGFQHTLTKGCLRCEDLSAIL
jgi:hypothetical protein